jgi:hypothetical protein
VQERDAVGAQERLVGIVRRHDHADAGARERAHLVEHARLVAEVEARGRLVHDDQRRVLRERARDERELPLAPDTRV